MNGKRWLVAVAAGVAIVATGCRSTCSGTANRTDNRGDRFCSTAGSATDGRLAAMPGAGCDPVVTSFGQPGAVFSDGPVVGSMPGMGTPIQIRPENELPFPQTIPNPGVPAIPPIAGGGRSAFEAHMSK